MATKIALPPIEPFKDELLQDQKDLALKILEEAAEVFGAYQRCDTIAMEYECIDVIQAVVNFVASVSDNAEDATFSMEDNYHFVHQINRGRGRYADE